ncbi:MAG: helix-turn-helix domain-containing protein [Filimonas sp.]|nr:helix-turn-helix domain-containing protein [Filimonas sp.]
MIKEYAEKTTTGRFVMHLYNEQLSGKGLRLIGQLPVNTFVFNKGEAQQVVIDEVSYTMPASSILPLVSNQHFVFERPGDLVAWQFNRDFYCIVDHDKEVGCVGFLFYGIRHPMFIQLSGDECAALLHLQELFLSEWKYADNFQGEMLRILLKRLIIQTTRIAKLQCEHYSKFPEDKMDLIRQFSLLLEANFRKEHEVRFYAAALNKSPKTLTNIFALLQQSSPSKLIQQRIVQEAMRYAYYTQKSAKEIAYELGFESPAHFSRFVKQHSGKNISDLRKKD